MTDPRQRRLPAVVIAGLCLWIGVSQAWYYVQFRDLFKPLLTALFRSLWR